MLDDRDVLAYLVERKLESAESIMLGDITVRRVTRRNTSFEVLSKMGPSYWVKSASSATELALMRREHAAYEMLSGVSDLRDRVPRCFAYDSESDYGFLVLEHLGEAKNVAIEARVQDAFPWAEFGGNLGELLGALHRLNPPEDGRWQTELTLLDGFRVHQPDARVFEQATPAEMEVLSVIQAQPSLVAALEGAAASWCRESLIHGDLKFDNLLWSQGTARSGVYLVDWESATLGDPGWDVGSVFADFLVFWVSSVPLPSDISPRSHLGSAKFPLVSLIPGIQAFWSRYVSERWKERPPNLKPDRFLIRSLEYTAIRLIQAALELTQTSEKMTTTVVCILQMSTNILQNPTSAATALLGLARA